MTEPASYFLRVGDRRFRPTSATEGAWTAGEQHIAPLCGLVVHAIDRFVAARPADGMVVARLSIDILGVVALEDFDVSVEVVRPGRTIELVEAVATWAGRTVVRARAWRMAAPDTSAVAGGAPDRLPAPESLTPYTLGSLWSGGYIASLELRPAGPGRPGRNAVWIRTPLALVADEPVSPLARYVGLVDTANGIAVRESPKEWLFPNLDLTIHLHRQPVGEWVGLDTTVIFGAEGQGLTSSVLHDEQGPIGRAEQILTIRPAR